MLTVTFKPLMLSVVYAECRYAECHGAIKKCLAKKVSLSEYS
jgi:hypothetical protein